MEDLDNPSSVRPLETPGLEARNPDWCPDPEQPLLVFEGRAESRREIWMINVKSGELTQITRGGGDNQPDWSPDCNQVAFGRFDVTDPFQIEDLYVVNLGNQKEKRIETRLTSTKDVSEGNVSWSPDGDWLAFARKTDTNGDGRITGDDRNELWTVSPSGSTEPQRRRTSDKFSVLSPSWSPDSDQILFAAYYAKDSFELWIYSVVTDQAMKIPGLDMGAYYYPQWSP
jgi:Tol biopolymer transport system component